MKSSTPFILDDAEDLDGFLAKAQEAWESRHPDKKKHRGRPYKEEVLDAIKADFTQRPPSPKISQENRINTIKKTLDEQYGSGAPSKDTVQRYVRQFMYIKKAVEDSASLSCNNAIFLNKNVPASEQALNQFIDALKVIIPLTAQLQHGIMQIRQALESAGIPPSKKMDRLVSRLVRA